MHFMHNTNAPSEIQLKLLVRLDKNQASKKSK